MKLRMRMAWFEIATGFLTLFAAGVAFTAPGGGTPGIAASWAARIVATGLFLAFCAIFLSHGLGRYRLARALCFSFFSAVSIACSAWFAFGGRYETAVLQGFLGVWYGAVAFFQSAFPSPGTHEASRFQALNLYVAPAYAALSVLRMGLHSLVSLFGAGSLMCTAFLLVWAELRGKPRTRTIAASLASAAALIAAIGDMVAGSDERATGALLVLFSVMAMSVARREDSPESADDLTGLTRRQQELHVQERAAETALWAIVASSALYVNFIDRFDARLYFAAAFLFAAAMTLGFRLKSARDLDERKYPPILSLIVLASVLFISATGGASGPFVFLAYLVIYVGAAIAAPAWSVVASAAFAAYVMLEFLAWRLSPEAGAASLSEISRHAAEAVSCSATLVLTGFYAVWTRRRRAKIERSLLDANHRLAEVLKTAVHEREQSRKQSEEQRRLNDDLVRMRSALMNVLEDVEESKRQIQLDRRRQTASLNALGEGVIAAEKDGKIFLCNPAGAHLLGLEPEAVIGKPFDQTIRLFLEDSDVLQTAAFEAAFAGRGAELGRRLMLLRSDGRRLAVSGTVAPYFDETNRLSGIVLAFRDVTLERDIDRQKSDFISIASHQLRTPLSALRWFLDLLLAGDAGPLQPTQKEYLTDMSVSTARMIKLVGDLLDVTRIESGRLKASPERVEVAGFLAGLLREYAPLIKSRDIRFTSDIAPEARTFHADPNLVYQAISNILSNAVKYTPDGGTVTLSVRVVGSECVFAVRDTGVGIPKNQQYRVYDKFFRGENVVAKETVGSGIGLYVTHLIVELSGGRTWFESREGKGTVFYVALPVKPPEGTLAS